MQKYGVKFISSGSKLELIRDIDESSPIFTQPYKEKPAYEDAIIIPKEKLQELISKLPENQALVLGTGRHAFAIIRENDSYIIFDSNSEQRIPAFINSHNLAKYLLETTYVSITGSYVPVSLEILAQENQEINDYVDLRRICDVYRKNENAFFVNTETKQFYPVDGITPLIISITANLIQTATNLVDNKIGITTTDAIGFSPIHYAAFSGLNNIIKKLIANGVNVNQEVIKGGEQLNDVSLSFHDAIRGTTPLFFACLSNNVETVNMLLDNGADINKASVSGLTPIMAAITQGHYELVKLLISRGAKLDSIIHALPETEYQKSEIPRPTALEYFGAIYLPDYEGFNAVMLAAKQNQPKIVFELLKAGVDIKYSNQYGLSLLHICIMNGILNHELLNYKPDVNSLVKFSPGSNQLISPLWIACYKNSPEMVQLLLENGANPNVKMQDELSSLIKAVENGSLEIINLLAGHGADLKIKIEDETLLDIAIKNGHSHLVEFLLQNGVVPHDASERSGGTLELAIKHSKTKESQLESISLILSWMTRNNRSIPNNLDAIGNVRLLLNIYGGLTNGKLSSPLQLCKGLGYVFNEFTNPISSSHFTMYTADQTSIFTELSDQFYKLDNPTFADIKLKIQIALNENKLSKAEIKFLQVLDRLVDDFKMSAKANINAAPAIDNKP